MRTGTKQTVGLTIISCLIAGTLIAAEGKENAKKGRRSPGSGELKAYKAKQEKVRKEFREARHEENVTFRESLKEKMPSDALPSIITQRETQYATTKTFMSGLYTEFVAYAREVMTKHEVPTERQEALAKRMEERHDERVTKHAEMHKKLIAALEALKGNEDLTFKQIKETIRANTPERDGKHGNGHRGQKNKNGKDK